VNTEPVAEADGRNAAATETGITASALRRRLADRLEAAFVADGRSGTSDLDARLLVAHALALDATGLILNAARPVSEADVARAMAMAERRIAGEPVARILGEKAFWTLTLQLSPETLVPRPDTETVVEAAVDWARREGRQDESLTVLDLGTGSGAILLALLSELPMATGVGTDLAEGAARTARINAERLGLSDRARFAVGDWMEALKGRFDLVVSNPPYIKSEEIPHLALEVRGFDPDMALDGGSDGLAAYRTLLRGVEHVLADGGAAFFELGSGQADSVMKMAEMLGFHGALHKDIAGIDRVFELQRGKTSR